MKLLSSTRFGVRAIALFEAAKGLLVLLAGLGLLSLIHRDVQAMAEAIIRHSHFNPASKYPRIFLEASRHLTNKHLWMYASLAVGYAAVRFVEAYGLWKAKAWAEWFAIVAGGIYLPVEIFELAAKFTWFRVDVLTANTLIVVYLGYVIWKKRRAEKVHEDYVVESTLAASAGARPPEP